MFTIDILTLSHLADLLNVHQIDKTCSCEMLSLRIGYGANGLTLNILKVKKRFSLMRGGGNTMSKCSEVSDCCIIFTIPPPVHGDKIN